MMIKYNTKMVCTNCRNASICLEFIKFVNITKQMYDLIMELSEDNVIVDANIEMFKCNSFQEVK